MINSFNCLCGTVSHNILWISYRKTNESGSPCSMYSAKYFSWRPNFDKGSEPWKEKPYSHQTCIKEWMWTFLCYQVAFSVQLRNVYTFKTKPLPIRRLACSNYMNFSSICFILHMEKLLICIQKFTNHLCWVYYLTMNARS